MTVTINEPIIVFIVICFGVIYVCQLICAIAELYKWWLDRKIKKR